MRIKSVIKALCDLEMKERLLAWGNRNEFCVWLDSNTYREPYGRYQALLAVGNHACLRMDANGAFAALEEFQKKIPDWLFGYLSYDLKNDIEALGSNNWDGLQFPELYFIQPTKVILLKEKEIEFQYLPDYAQEITLDWQDIQNENNRRNNDFHQTDIKIHLRTTKDHYHEKVEKMLAHIERGDIYEANFCQEFYSEGVDLNPLKTYWHLNEISKPPFACFLKLGNLYALSASPERYLQKKGATIISQPIKGTSKRSSEQLEDQILAEYLSQDPKERSENIMIADLVRNDLSRFALKGSVEVEELCKVYTFEQVHQLISTIRCKVSQDESPVRFLRDTFPMGSMTGAPKISAMKIIEALEDSKRGLYSGAIGYFTPEGDFDFNVVIRSILYNANLKYVSFSVGGAITANSIVEREYEECLVKAKAMRDALEK